MVQILLPSNASTKSFSAHTGVCHLISVTRFSWVFYRIPILRTTGNHHLCGSPSGTNLQYLPSLQSGGLAFWIANSLVTRLLWYTCAFHSFFLRQTGNCSLSCFPSVSTIYSLPTLQFAGWAYSGVSPSVTWFSWASMSVPRRASRDSWTRPIRVGNRSSDCMGASPSWRIYIFRL